MSFLRGVPALAKAVGNAERPWGSPVLQHVSAEPAQRSLACKTYEGGANREEGRTSRDGSGASRILRLGMSRDPDVQEWTGLDRQMNKGPFDALSGRAQPLTQKRGMGVRVMVGVVNSVRRRLEGQSHTHQEQTDGKPDGNSFDEL